MIIRRPMLFVRSIQWVLILGLAFSGCTCSEETPPPPPKPPAAAPAAAAPTTPVAAPVPPTAVPATEPTPAPAAAAPDEKQAECERTLAALVSPNADAKALGSAAARALAEQSPDLVTCAAVMADSDALCKQFFPLERGPSRMCVHTQALFHELRAYPQGRSFMFDEIDYQECRGIPSMPATYCDSLREALRSGSVDKCASAGDGESVCRAYFTLDKSLCVVKGNVAKLEITLPDQKKGEPAKMKVKDGLVERCKQVIDSRAFLAKGLKTLAESGPDRERELAKAALGQAGACGALAKAAGVCAPSAPPPAPEGTPAGAPGAANGGGQQGAS